MISFQIGNENRKHKVSQMSPQPNLEEDIETIFSMPSQLDSIFSNLWQKVKELEQRLYIVEKCLLHKSEFKKVVFKKIRQQLLLDYHADEQNETIIEEYYKDIVDLKIVNKQMAELSAEQRDHFWKYLQFYNVFEHEPVIFEFPSLEEELPNFDDTTFM